MPDVREYREAAVANAGRAANVAKEPCLKASTIAVGGSVTLQGGTTFVMVVGKDGEAPFKFDVNTAGAVDAAANGTEVPAGIVLYLGVQRDSGMVLATAAV
jgi:hypothetical protein